jgi:hypothetical protein
MDRSSREGIAAGGTVDAGASRSPSPATANRRQQAVLGSLLTAGLVAATVVYATRKRRREEASRREALEASRRQAEQALQRVAKSVVLDVLKSDDTLALVGELLVKAATAPVVKAEFGAFMAQQFTAQDAPSWPVLKKFLVEDVVKDAWVKDTLLDVAVNDLGRGIRNDKQIWPNATVECLKHAALTALAQPVILEKGLETLSDSARRAVPSFSPWAPWR